MEEIEVETEEELQKVLGNTKKQAIIEVVDESKLTPKFEFK